MRTAIAFALTLASCAAVAQERAPLFDGMGNHTFSVTTKSAEAQKYFDQGLVLAYGFNEEEAHRSFLYAAKLDPECAMAYWGAALVLGPNLNSRMPSSDSDKARNLAAQAQEKLDDERPVERALISALQKRYAAGRSRSDADKDYADAMREVAKQFPDDGDVVTLAAESLMDLHPWNFWTNEKVAQPWTQEVLDMLDRAIKLDPTNPGANHFIIHAWEASPTPARAVECADRLGSLAPGVEHLVHMPGHIFYRIGRYHDGLELNVKATEAYDSYAQSCRDQGMQPIGGYEMHNWDFVWTGANIEGRSALAIKAAKKFGDDGSDSKLPFTYVRFGKWDEIMRLRASEDKSEMARAAIYYARAIARARKGDAGGAQSEYSALLDVIGQSPRSTNEKIMRDVAAGEIAAARGDFTSAVRLLESAKSEEDSVTRGELPSWHQPVRLVLGKVLIDAGRFADAEKAYRESLVPDPENGWSLIGLAQALEGEGNSADAARAMARFRTAWQYADVVLTASRF